MFMILTKIFISIPVSGSVLTIQQLMMRPEMCQLNTSIQVTDCGYFYVYRLTTRSSCVGYQCHEQIDDNIDIDIKFHSKFIQIVENMMNVIEDVENSIKDLNSTYNEEDLALSQYYSQSIENFVQLFHI